MLIPPKYILTPKISELLASIEASRQVIDSVSIPGEIEANIRRKATLRSSLFSARIEGNPLIIEEVTHAPSHDQKRREVNNTLKGLNWVYKRGVNKDLTAKQILELHKIVMSGLVDSGNLGRFRKEQGAIFNSAGYVVYMSARPSQVNSLMSRLLNFANGPKERFVPIRACLTHYTFERIHPFLDGNGRVGRLLLQAILAKNDYCMKGLLAFEEYLDTHRNEYYASLEVSEKEVSDYLEFMLSALAKTAQEAKEEILKKQTLDAVDLLLPRRAEILQIIRDHKMINFDFIRRRFLAVNERTLRYDLRQLANDGLIKKRGSTKGVYYQSVD
ncbi:MAG: Fic family protein [Candidatus Blackburnbacteria bacterium]|nr:Fic family protein [Candidatus Blackburnbacteria bacterium]